MMLLEMPTSVDAKIKLDMEKAASAPTSEQFINP